ncbi:hypothetical protein CPB84DRAFT_1788694 [Gymnopilus junonius]|uniref:Uncharacterized protein n=1 Tax=Gymnopilus junonius TaxID=109634 RepID=A0A9P5TIK6_GYMJU|nr:hypothetical protein CPB84DRAFT_1788694 [Gymnopilus junonius]
MENSAISLVLNHLNSIQRLVLRERGERPMTWASIEKDTVSSLLKILQSPSLRSLELERFRDFPIGTIKKCKRLNEISLMHIECSTEEHFVISGFFLFPAQIDRELTFHDPRNNDGRTSPA